MIRKRLVIDLSKGNRAEKQETSHKYRNPLTYHHEQYEARHKEKTFEQIWQSQVCRLTSDPTLGPHRSLRWNRNDLWLQLSDLGALDWNHERARA